MHGVVKAYMKAQGVTIFEGLRTLESAEKS